MQKIIFCYCKKLKNTESAQLCTVFWSKTNANVEMLNT